MIFESYEEINALILKYLSQKILREKVTKNLPKYEFYNDGVRNFLEVIRHDLDLNHGIKAVVPNQLYYDDLIHMGYDYKSASLHNERGRYLLCFEKPIEMNFTILAYGGIFEVPSKNHLKCLILNEIEKI